MRFTSCVLVLAILLSSGCGDDDNSNNDNGNGNADCTADELRCSATGNVETCDSDGAGWTQTDICSDGCENAACTPVSCTAGTLRCSAAGNVETCNQMGDGWSVTEVCFGECVDNTCESVESVQGDMHYKVDQFGYLPNDPKVAVISQAVQGQFSPDTFEPGSTLEVRSYPDGEAVFSGAPVAWSNGDVDANSGDRGWWFDFSSVTTPGTYTLYDVDRDLFSHAFDVGEDVYRLAMVHAMRTYFYQREAFAKQEPYADSRWTDTASFMNDTTARYVFDQGNAALERDVSGGWMDAGDSNKYVTFLDGVLHNLLMSYQERPLAWGDAHNIPESGNGVPDILDEINYAIEWLRKMQDTDGGVFIKSGDEDHHSASPPSSHNYPRFYGLKCSSSTISVAAMFAHTAYVFQDVGPLATQAAELTPLAEAAWDHYHTNTRDDACDNGEILSGDADRSLEEQDQQAARAALWLWALTGDATYHDYFRNNFTVFDAMTMGWWGPYLTWDEDALLFYTGLPGADSAVVSAILDSKLAGTNDSVFYGFGADDSLYRAAMPDWAFHWGSNMARASAGTLNTNVIRYGLDASNDAGYRQRALEILHWFHGVNPHGKVMLSNMYDYGAENSVNEFYHSWFADGSAWDSVLEDPFVGPAPGYLVGGPNSSYTGGVTPPAGEPPAKSYIDFNNDWPDNSWEVTENGIYYQAAYIRLVAYFVSAP